MKIEFSVEAETAADLLNALKNFVGDTGIGENADVKAPIKKSADKDPEDETPAKKKKAAEKEPEEEKAATHEDARGAIVALATKLGWDPAPPKIQAFTKKFAKAHDLTETVDGEEVLISRIPQIPVKKLKAFLQAIKDEADI